MLAAIRCLAETSKVMMLVSVCAASQGRLPTFYNRLWLVGKVNVMSKKDCLELQGHQLWDHSLAQRLAEAMSRKGTSICKGCRSRVLMTNCNHPNNSVYTAAAGTGKTGNHSAGLGSHIELMSSTAVPHTGTGKCPGDRCTHMHAKASIPAAAV